MNLRIVSDEDILGIETVFSDLGELVKIPGRQMTRDHLREADAILVRSITPVNQALLKDTSVRFVGSATSGTDHIDLEYLNAHKIAFSDAAGCNANAVVEYCVTALFSLAWNNDIELKGRSVGIIGAGNVGSRLAGKLSRLGFDCLICDPFLPQEKQQQLVELNCELVDFDEAITAEIVSLHVPLTVSGDHPTYHMLNRDNLNKLVTGCILLNTSRGAVIDTQFFRQFLDERKDVFAVLDVWEEEPEIDLELLRRVVAGTPHIAGYSLDAKIYSSVKLGQELSRFFALSFEPEASQVLTSAPITISMSSSWIGDCSGYFCAPVLNQVLPITEIDKNFRQQAVNEQQPLGKVFDKLRRTQANRREFKAYELEDSQLPTEQANLLRELGFRIKPLITSGADLQENG